MSAPRSPAPREAGQHISVSRQGLDQGPLAEAMAPLGPERDVATIVTGFATALALARSSDLLV